MRLYLVRHAIADEPDAKRWTDDRQRPLTAAGARRFKRSAALLGHLIQSGGTVERLLTSPLVRARETAAILHRAGLPAPIEESVLAPGRTAARVLAVLRAHDAQSIVMVGHEPDLGRLLAVCVAGPDAKLSLRFRKGGAACLSFTGAPRVGEATLEWLLPPKALRALRD
ncbi:MAG TPA: histidine phosphatase family protein [Steroidobacteraceae bacterium]|jgi:phosphohistidine phosphatase|nr:histidine phosphatase family protein [Steroidobacteraceae bacterium]